jgi:hypothetical protein
MNRTFFEAPLSDDFAHVIPMLSDGVHGLWLEVDFSTSSENQFQHLMPNLSPLRGILWHASKGVGTSSRIRDYKRALGQWTNLIEELVQKTTLQGLSENDTAYSDVGWLSADASSMLHTFFQRSTSERDAILAFVPNGEIASREWGKWTQLWFWLWLRHLDYLDSRDVASDAIRVIRSSVDFICSHGGVLTLIWRDCDANRGLLLLGQPSQLEALSENLVTKEYVHSPALKTHLIQKGVYLPLCPW